MPFPDVSSTQVQIVMKSPGMTPEEVESRIVVPIEQEMLGIPHQTVLRSQSKYATCNHYPGFCRRDRSLLGPTTGGMSMTGVMSALPGNASGWDCAYDDAIR